MRSLLFLTVLLSCVGAPLAEATEQRGELPGALTDEQLKEQGFSPLIQGETLDGWNVRPWHKKHWTFREGVMDYDGKAEHKQFQRNSLWTTTKYGDLVLYAEWRLPAKPAMKQHPIVLYNGDFLLDDQGWRITRPRLDAGDSGLLFRGTSKCQANTWSQELGSGEINGYRTDKKMPPEVRRACIPLKKADRPLGQWNAFLITLRGNVMTVQLNSETVIPAAALPDLPAVGPIGLQHHGDPVQFRRLWIKSIDGQ
jgi:3-keto-disaccharide hydrolase